MERKHYPSDVTDEEWAFAAPYLTLMTPHAPQREHDLREVYNALRWVTRTGAQWRYIPHDLPPWAAVYQQARRWYDAGVFDTMMHDLRVLLRIASGHNATPCAAIIDSRTVQSTPESGDRAGYDGAKRRKGSKIHAAVDTLGNLLALHASPASQNDRDHVGELCASIGEATEGRVEHAWVDQGYTGARAFDAAAESGIELVVVKLPEAKRGFVLLPRRWVVERSFAWISRFRRLARDHERLSQVFVGLHLVAFSSLMLRQLIAMH